MQLHVAGPSVERIFASPRRRHPDTTRLIVDRKLVIEQVVKPLDLLVEACVELWHFFHVLPVVEAISV